MRTTEPKYIRLNRIYTGEMPYSEVCMHMQIAGTVLQFAMYRPRRLNRKASRHLLPVVQLYRDGKAFSAPIGYGEAGIYRNARRHWWQIWRRWYYYPPKN